MTPDRWLQIKEILNAALERPKSERFAYVETVCGADTTLRGEVERLLAQETAESLASPAAQLFRPIDALTSGEMFAQYRVEKKVGEGGMGAVYLARDTKLGRNIALKVLPEALATDANLARLRREAKVLASLNHPHIATIYGLEQNALVMEFIEGPTLAERIDRGPIPLPEALAIARQMAEALDYAHEKGVIHRDLKPANIKIALGGGVKVLDFGLAKMVDPDGQPVADSVLSVERLGAGAILGTPAYMAPEQASGGTVDWRADVWAFGVVLFEMLTGQTLFGRGAVSDTLSAVLSHVPDWALLPKDTPHWVRNLLRRCLERDKSKRLRHLGDAWQTGDSGEPPAAPSRLPWIAAAGIALVAILASWSPCRTPQALSLRFDIDAGGVPNSIAVSPNGMRVVFRAGDIRAATPLLTRRLDDDRTIPLAGTEGGRDPFFSPDGRWLAFFADGKLRKISIDGGLPVTICDALNGRGGAWGEDGSIVVALDVTGGLSRVDSNGGQAQLITGLHGEVDSGEAHRWPQMLPQGKGVLYTALSGQQTSLWILPRGSTRPKMLLANARDARVLPGGQLIYFKQGSLQAAPIDIDRLALTGPGVPLLPNVAPFLNARASYGLARSGTLVYVRGGQEPNRVVSWLDASGKLEPLLAESGRYLTPRLSPDGKRLAVAIEKGDGANVWVYDIVRDTMIPMPVGGEYQFYPVWSPDGQHLVFQSDGQLAWTRADGSGPIH
ncbi:MAG: protein kinase [Bryobacterales bacterium]|nr:protein kinase [Bryobacterales bacterium]